MTRLELDAHRELREKLNKANEMLYNLEAKAVPGSPSLDDMPHGYGVSDKVGDLAIEINDLKARIACYKTLISDQEKEITKFLSGLKSDKLRIIVRLRYIRCFSWDDIADIIDDDVSGDSIRMACYRNLE